MPDRAGTRQAHDAARRRELAAFLRARRARVKPADVGLPEGVSRRRTPGLRREELAQVSGVGLTWYTWLEQGRDIPASRQIIDALANALRMDEDERRHLFTLADLPLPPVGEVNTPPAPLRRMLNNLSPNPGYVIDERFDILAWNAAQAALWIDFANVPADRRNLVWLMFTDASVRTLLLDWASTARMVVAQFRASAGKHPEDTGFDRLAGELADRSEEFRQTWETYSVAEFDVAVNHLDHPICGRLDLDLFHLRVAEHPTLTVVMQTPVTAADADRLRMLPLAKGGAAALRS
jgi:transcriptional regulator with XRE-family HTH domain